MKLVLFDVGYGLPIIIRTLKFGKEAYLCDIIIYPAMM